MKHRFLAPLLLALLPALTHAVWLDSKGKPLPDKPSRQTLGTFGAQVLLVSDEKRLDQQWKALPLPTKLSKTDTARRGSPLSAAVFFFGCEANKEGLCDVVAQFTVIAPNGAKMKPVAGPVWRAKAPPKEAPQLSPLRMKVLLDQTDPAGKYTVVTKVKDRVSGKMATLTSTFTLKK